MANDAAEISGEPGAGRMSGERALRPLAGAVGIAFVITVIGGYRLGWAWTGFTDNNTVWEWLHLLVLPVVLAAAPVWYRTRHELRVEWRLLTAGILGAFAVLLAGGYGLGWKWTGFEGHTLWDWLELLVLPVTVTVLSIRLSLGRGLHPRVRLAGGGLVVAFALLVMAGYAFEWEWTGFPGNTLWDWLHLLLVPFVLPIGLVWFSTRPRPEPEPEETVTAPVEAG